jgi:hypothetical protein
MHFLKGKQSKGIKVGEQIQTNVQQTVIKAVNEEIHNQVKENIQENRDAIREKINGVVSAQIKCQTDDIFNGAREFLDAIDNVNETDETNSNMRSIQNGSADKQMQQDKNETKMHTFVFGSMGLFLAGFFIDLNILPVYKFLSIPIQCILSLFSLIYFARYEIKRIHFRFAIITLTGIPLGISAQLLTTEYGIYKEIVDNKPFLLIPVIVLTVLLFCTIFRYITEISKPKHERWKIK